MIIEVFLFQLWGGCPSKFWLDWITYTDIVRLYIRIWNQRMLSYHWLRVSCKKFKIVVELAIWTGMLRLKILTNSMGKLRSKLCLREWTLMAYQKLRRRSWKQRSRNNNREKYTLNVKVEMSLTPLQLVTKLKLKTYPMLMHLKNQGVTVYLIKRQTWLNLVLNKLVNNQENIKKKMKHRSGHSSSNVTSWTRLTITSSKSTGMRN